MRKRLLLTLPVLLLPLAVVVFRGWGLAPAPTLVPDAGQEDATVARRRVAVLTVAGVT